MKTALSPSPDGSRLVYAAFSNELTAESSLPELSSIYLDRRRGKRPQGSLRYVQPDRVRTSMGAHGHPVLPIVRVRSQLIGLVTERLSGRSTRGEPGSPPDRHRNGRSIDGDHHAPEPDHGHRVVSGQPKARGEPHMVPARGDGAAGRDRAECLEEADPAGSIFVDVETGDVDEVVSTAGMAHVHGWSPDGDLIEYTQHAGTYEGNEVSMYSVSGGQVVVGGPWKALAVGAWRKLVAGRWPSRGTGRTGRPRTPHGEGSLHRVSRREWPWVLPFCQVEGAFEGEDCLRGPMVWSPDGMSLAYRAFIKGTPIVAALILQGVDDSSTEVVRLDRPTFYTAWSDDRACCLAWLPAAA